MLFPTITQKQKLLDIVCGNLFTGKIVKKKIQNEELDSYLAS
jgi:hypothetical protein